MESAVSIALNRKQEGFIILVDYHVYTELSDDSVHLMENVVRNADRMNMDEICFTGRVGYGINYIAATVCPGEAGVCA